MLYWHFLIELQNSKKLITKRKSVSQVDPTTGQKVTDIKESTGYIIALFVFYLELVKISTI